MKIRLAGSGKECQPGDRSATFSREQAQQRYVHLVDGVHACGVEHDFNGAPAHVT
jgi:hypothetical protein